MVLTILSSSFYVSIVLLYSFRDGRPNLPVVIESFKCHHDTMFCSLFFGNICLLITTEHWGNIFIIICYNTKISVLGSNGQLRDVFLYVKVRFMTLSISLYIYLHWITSAILFLNHSISLGPSPFFAMALIFPILKISEWSANLFHLMDLSPSQIIDGCI